MKYLASIGIDTYEKNETIKNHIVAALLRIGTMKSIEFIHSLYHQENIETFKIYITFLKIEKFN